MSEATVDKTQLFTPRLPEDTVDLDGVGTVRVRALSRIEVFLAQKIITDEAAHERKILRFGMVDPALSEAEAERWQQASPGGELQPVLDKIRELSKLDEAAPKSDISGNGREPGPGVRPLPSGDAVDDGREDAPGDQQ